jgi:tetratricopeptide (TPR) repeat protein
MARIQGQLLRRQVEDVLNVPQRREAEAHVRNKEWRKAIPLLDRLIQADGTFWPDLAARGNCHAELGELKKAHLDYARALQLERGSFPDSWGVYWSFHLLSQALGDEPGCRHGPSRLVERFGKSNDYNELFWLSLNCRFPQAGVDRARVVGWAEKVARASPENRGNQLELGFALFRAGRYREALERFLTLQQPRPDAGHEAHLLFYLAMLHHHLGRAEEARRHLCDAVEWVDRFADTGVLPPRWTDPPNWVWRLDWQRHRREAEALIGAPTPSGVGRLMRDKKWAQAVRLLDRRLAAEPRSVLDLETQELCNVECQQWDRVAADWAKLVELTPDDTGQWGQLTTALMAAGKDDDVCRVCREQFERFAKRDHTLMRTHLGYSCVRLPNSIPDFDALAALVPDEARLLVAVLYRAGRFREAIEKFDQACRTWGPRAWDWVFLSMTHARLGQTEQAREYLDRARRLAAEADGRPYGWGVAWGWWGEKIEVEHLIREAEALLAQKK